MAQAGRKELQQLEFDPTSAADAVVRRWLEEEVGQGCLRGVPAKQRLARLGAACELGRRLYHDFLAAFARAFCAQPAGEVALSCPGERWVRRTLRRRLNFYTQGQVDAVLDVIREKFSHLLDGFRGKYQPSLLAGITYDVRRMDGYMAQVASIESWHIPLDEWQWARARALPVDAATRDGADANETPGTPEADVDLLRSQDMAERLRGFYCPENGFARRHRLEALVGLGHGSQTGSRRVAKRCAKYLEAKLPSWEAERAELRGDARELTLKRADLKERLAVAVRPKERERLTRRLERCERRLERLQARLALHVRRLRPRPEEMRGLLAGILKQKLGTVRFQRRQREVELMTHRVEVGAARLKDRFPDELPVTVRVLFDDMETHLEKRPPSASAHGLEADEKEERAAEWRTWRADGRELLSRVREQQALCAKAPHSPELREALGAWLLDCEDLYEFGVLAAKPGLFPALGRRHGSRLEWLLRVSPEVVPISTRRAARGRRSSRGL